MNSLHDQFKSSDMLAPDNIAPEKRPLQDGVLQSARESVVLEAAGGISDTSNASAPTYQITRVRSSPTAMTRVKNLVAERPGAAAAVAAGVGAVATALIRYAIARRRARSARTYRY
jgi:hypothetical protein